MSKAVLYDGSAASAGKIMDLIGTTGVLNTRQGLYIIRPEIDVVVKSGEKVRLDKGEISIIPK